MWLGELFEPMELNSLNLEYTSPSYRLTKIGKHQIVLIYSIGGFYA